ncbi:MAG: TIGR02996 domain-containing protein [Gemmataceae bacterium]|nr:TIGR02996 domain-containing protein [Gemmataceae bacterium]
MRDDEALLAAVIQHPDEDTPRLIYADWLQDHGRPERAEFIRFQVERDRLPFGADARRRELLARETALLERHRKRWFDPFRCAFGAVKVTFRRGFVEHLETDAQSYLASSQALYRSAPLRSVVVRDTAAELLALSTCPRPAGVRLRARLDVFLGLPPARTTLIDLLAPAPAAPEPWLGRGERLVLAWATSSLPDRLAAVRLATSVLIRRAVWAVEVGVRPFDEIGEFATWCRSFCHPVGPVWLRFRAGRLVWAHVGLDPPDEFRDHFYNIPPVTVELQT